MSEKRWTLYGREKVDLIPGEDTTRPPRFEGPELDEGETVEVMPASDYEALAKRVEELEGDPLRLTVEEADTIRTAYLDGTPAALDDSAGIIQRLGDAVDALNPSTGEEDGTDG